MVTVRFDDPADRHKWNVLNSKTMELMDQHRYAEARQTAQKAHKFALEVSNAQLVTNSLSNLGNLELTVGNLDKAESYLREALDIAIAYAGKEHLETAMVVAALATLYYHKRNYQLAEAGYLEAIRVKKMHLPPSHHSLSKTMLNLSEMYRQLGNKQKAEKWLQESSSGNSNPWRP